MFYIALPFLPNTNPWYFPHTAGDNAKVIPSPAPGLVGLVTNDWCVNSGQKKFHVCRGFFLGFFCFVIHLVAQIVNPTNQDQTHL